MSSPFPADVAASAAAAPASPGACPATPRGGPAPPCRLRSPVSLGPLRSARPTFIHPKSRELHVPSK